jgi:DNA-directed RNA polymerase specialized sigma24 family protein
VTLPSVLPLTHVIWRCNRYGAYIRWLNRGSLRVYGPQQVRSAWGAVMQGKVQQNGAPAGDSCPVNAAEALETGRCIAALPDEMREAIIQEHVIGGTQQEKADYLKIDRTTFWRRCERAYPRLLEMMNLAAAGLPLES